MAKPITILKRLRDTITGADQISKDMTGNYIFRKGYFYRMGMDADKFADRVEAGLKHLGLKYRILDSGDHWAAFRGNQSIKQGSHFWVKVKIEEPKEEEKQ